MPGLGYQENHLPFAQAALGHDVHIVTADRPVPDARLAATASEDAQHYRPGRSSHHGVTLHRLPVIFEISRRNNLCLRGLARTLDTIGPDVVHLHGVTPFTTLQVLLGPQRSRRAVLVDHHLCHFNLHPWTPVKRAWYWCWR